MPAPDRSGAPAAELLRRRDAARLNRMWCELALIMALDYLDEGKPIELFMQALVDAYREGPGTPGWIQPVTPWGGRPPGLEGLDPVRFEQALVEWEKTPGEPKTWDEVLCSDEYAAISKAMDDAKNLTQPYT